MPLVTPQGFAPVEPIEFVPLDTVPTIGAAAVDLPNDADAQALTARFGGIGLIRIPFPKSDDGRGFSLARRLRDLGYRGRLRAQGHVISDQFRYALDCGFDEVEIDEGHAKRQPEPHWRAEAGRPNYRDKLRGRAAPAIFPVPAGVHAETVTEVAHYTDRLFRFRITRPASFRFRSGEFVMIGLPGAEKPLFRAYSIASPAWDDELEFFSIKVPEGPLTAQLQRIRPGDTVLMKKKATGTLVNDALTSGERLYLFATGTGIAPFASLVRDPETYDKFGQVILVHTCRATAELRYGVDLVEAAKADPLVGGEASRRLLHYAATTRETSPRIGRITTLVECGALFRDLGLPRFAPTTDRAMICGSIAMIRDVRTLCEAAGFTEGANSRPAEFVVERAFVG
jgi:ferredoxin--NADP+ reductase